MPDIGQIVSIQCNEDNPSDFLPSGQKMTIRWTEHAQDLLAEGHIILIDNPPRVQRMIANDPSLDMVAIPKVPGLNGQPL